MFAIRIIRFAVETAIIAVFAAVLSAMLIRSSPGFLNDARELDPQLSAASVAAIRAERAADANVARFVLKYVTAAMHGDFGESRSMNRPVSELLRDRAPATVQLVLSASALAVAAAVLLAAVTSVVRPRWPGAAVAGFNHALLTLPAGVVALLAVFWRVGVVAALAAVLAPRLYIYCARMFADRLETTYALTAEAFGVTRFRIMAVHIIPSLAPEIAGLASLAVVMGMGAAIPLEVLCGSSGVGRLAWQAAMQRDMPLVVAVTLVMVLITRVGTAASRALLPGGEAGAS